MKTGMFFFLIHFFMSLRCMQQLTIFDVALTGDMQKLNEYYVSADDLNKLNDYGETLLTYACQLNNLQLARFLFFKGASISRCDKNGAPPLYHAVHGSHEAMVKFLLSVGAQTTRPMGCKVVPLHYDAPNKNIARHLVLASTPLTTEQKFSKYDSCPHVIEFFVSAGVRLTQSNKRVLIGHYKNVGCFLSEALLSKPADEFHSILSSTHHSDSDIVAALSLAFGQNMPTHALSLYALLPEKTLARIVLTDALIFSYQRNDIVIFDLVFELLHLPSQEPANFPLYAKLINLATHRKDFALLNRLNINSLLLEKILEWAVRSEEWLFIDLLIIMGASTQLASRIEEKAFSNNLAIERFKEMKRRWSRHDQEILNPQPSSYFGLLPLDVRAYLILKMTHVLEHLYSARKLKEV